MKKNQLKHKIIATALVVAFVFQSLPRINEHTYTIGFSNFHSTWPMGIPNCFGSILPHMSHECGTPFHIN